MEMSGATVTRALHPVDVVTSVSNTFGSSDRGDQTGGGRHSYFPRKKPFSERPCNEAGRTDPPQAAADKL